MARGGVGSVGLRALVVAVVDAEGWGGWIGASRGSVCSGMGAVWFDNWVKMGNWNKVRTETLCP